MTTAATDSAAAARNGFVVPALPLALLEAVRSHDLPPEVLEDENVAISMPRRLGLSDVILSQIQRYEAATQSSRKVPMAELTELIRLILRRPDAAEILLDAGRTVARERYERMNGRIAKFYRSAPRRVTLRGVRRGIRRLLRAIAGNAKVTLKKPLIVGMADAPTASIDGTACVLYTGAIEELARLYTGGAGRAVHSRCRARGDDACEWTVDE
jgi:predicted hydrocarbon binding protein